MPQISEDMIELIQTELDTINSNIGDIQKVLKRSRIESFEENADNPSLLVGEALTIINWSTYDIGIFLPNIEKNDTEENVH